MDDRHAPEKIKFRLVVAIALVIATYLFGLYQVNLLNKILMQFISNTPIMTNELMDQISLRIPRSISTYFTIQFYLDFFFLRIIVIVLMVLWIILGAHPILVRWGIALFVLFSLIGFIVGLPAQTPVGAVVLSMKKMPYYLKNERVLMLYSQNDQMAYYFYEKNLQFLTPGEKITALGVVKKTISLDEMLDYYSEQQDKQYIKKQINEDKEVKGSDNAKKN